MTAAEILTAIKNGHYVSMKVSIKDVKGVKLEVISASGILVEEFSVERPSKLEKGIEQMQQRMLAVAGQYTNKGLYVNINPFVN